MKHVLPYVIVYILLVLGSSVSAHQPKIPKGTTTLVDNPEVSKAYYTALTGTPHTYMINSDTPFDLYINILLPYETDISKDISFTISSPARGEDIRMDGTTYQWTNYFEPFGADRYRQGPKFKQSVAAGTYEIIVRTPDNTGRYAIAIGEQEVFDAAATMDALQLIPRIKREFFGYSPINFLLSPMGAGYVIVLFIMSGLFGFLYRYGLKLIVPKSTKRYHKNIQTSGRWQRAAIGGALLLRALLTSWSPLLIFFSGFCLFEAIFSRCGRNALWGINECEL